MILRRAQYEAAQTTARLLGDGRQHAGVELLFSDPSAAAPGKGWSCTR